MDKSRVPDWGGWFELWTWIFLMTALLIAHTDLLAVLSTLFGIDTRQLVGWIAGQPLSPIVLGAVIVLVRQTLFSTKSHDSTSSEEHLPSVVAGVVGGRSFSEEPTSQSTEEWASNLPSQTRDLLMQSIVANSTAFELPRIWPTEGVGFIGYARETSLLRLARSCLGMGHVQQTRNQLNIVHVMPFDSRKRLMGTMIKLPNSSGYRLLLKGDPGTLMGYCTERLDRDGAARKTLTDADREVFEQTIEAYSERSLYPLGLVYRDLLPSEVEAGAFLRDGLITSADELRNMLNTRDKWFASVMRGMTFLGLFGIGCLHQPSRAMADGPKETAAARGQSLGPSNATPGKNVSGSAFEWHVLGQLNGKPVEALADTGANCNAISASCARERQLTPDPGSTQARIRLPSGKYCTSLGTTTLQFRFKGEDRIHNVECNIVPRLQQACVLALDFLRTTETLTNFKSRLKEVPLPNGRMSLRLMRDGALDSDSNNGTITGYIAGRKCIAMPDSGSSIMALSGSYVRSRQMTINTRKRCKVKFIDGSSAWTSGTVIAPWQFCQSRIPLWEMLYYFILYFLLLQPLTLSPYARPTWMAQEWHVIENMDVDAILSIDFIKQHDVFRAYESSFVSKLKGSDIFAAKIYGICPCAYPKGNKRLETLASSFCSDSKSYPKPPWSHVQFGKAKPYRSQSSLPTPSATTCWCARTPGGQRSTRPSQTSHLVSKRRPGWQRSRGGSSGTT